MTNTCTRTLQVKSYLSGCRLGVVLELGDFVLQFLDFELRAVVLFLKVLLFPDPLRDVLVTGLQQVLLFVQGLLCFLHLSLKRSRPVNVKAYKFIYSILPKKNQIVLTTHFIYGYVK